MCGHAERNCVDERHYRRHFFDFHIFIFSSFLSHTGPFHMLHWCLPGLRCLWYPLSWLRDWCTSGWCVRAAGAAKCRKPCYPRQEDHDRRFFSGDSNFKFLKDPETSGIFAARSSSSSSFCIGHGLAAFLLAVSAGCSTCRVPVSLELRGSGV